MSTTHLSFHSRITNTSGSAVRNSRRVSLANLLAFAVLLPDPGGVGGIPVGCRIGSSGTATSEAGDPGSVGGIPVSARVRMPGLDGGGADGVGGIPLSGDPGSAGGIPFISDPGGSGGIPVTVPLAPTAGLILDSTTAPLSGVTIL